MTATKGDRAAGRHNRQRALALGIAALGAAGIGYGALRAARRRAASRGPAGQVGAGPLDDLELPPGTRHLDIPVRDGGSVHVADWGEGPPIVFLHGLTLESSVWACQFHDLGDRHRMIALDLRGHGQTEAGDAGLTIDAMADDLADVLEALDLRRATVVGHSMGGMATLRFCRRHADVLADRVGAVAIVASTGGLAPPLEVVRRIAPRAIDLVMAGHAAINPGGHPIIPNNGAAQRGTRVVFGLHPDPAAVRKALDYARAMRPDRFISLLPAVVDFDERAVFEHLPVPCVVVVGDRDRMTPPRYSRALVAALPGARLVVWPGAGHMLMYERREALDWLLDQLSAEAADKGAGGSPE